MFLHENKLAWRLYVIWKISSSRGYSFFSYFYSCHMDGNFKLLKNQKIWKWSLIFYYCYYYLLSVWSFFFHLGYEDGNLKLQKKQKIWNRPTKNVYFWNSKYSYLYYNPALAIRILKHTKIWKRPSKIFF